MEPFAVPISEGCRLIGCKRTKFYELVKKKQIAVIKLGRRTLVDVDSLRRFVKSLSMLEPT